MLWRGSILFGAAVLSVCAAPFACGSDDVKVGDGADAGDGGGSLVPDGSTTSTTDGGNTTPGSDGGTVEDGSTTTTDGATGPRPADDAGVTADGGVDPPGAGPGGDTSSITCGTATCPIPAESCCIMESPGAGDRVFACVATATCPGNGDNAALKCSSGANCPSGTVCCVASNGDNATSSCKATCGNDEAQLCDKNAPDGGGCPPSDPCSSKDIKDWGNLPSTFATCGGQGN